MQHNAETSDVIGRITDAELIFVSYTNILRPGDANVFRDALSNAGYRLWRGQITPDEYDGIFGELKRDAKGTAAGYGRADNPRRIVTMPRRAKVVAA